MSSARDQMLAEIEERVEELYEEYMDEHFSEEPEILEHVGEQLLDAIHEAVGETVEDVADFLFGVLSRLEQEWERDVAEKDPAFPSMYHFIEDCQSVVSSRAKKFFNGLNLL
jgi:hypothetical protein